MKDQIRNLTILLTTLLVHVVAGDDRAGLGSAFEKKSHHLDCKDCCKGIGSCADNVGTIADGACNGVGACADNQGHIGKNSCDYMGSCADNQGKIGTGSCNGIGACADNNDMIGNNMCNRIGACADNDGVKGNAYKLDEAKALGSSFLLRREKN